MPATQTKRSFSGPPFISTKRLYNLVTDVTRKRMGKRAGSCLLGQHFRLLNMNRATQGVCWGRLFLAQFKGKIAIVVLPANHGSKNSK